MVAKSGPGLGGGVAAPGKTTSSFEIHFVFRRGGVYPLPSMGIEDSNFFQERELGLAGCGRGLTPPLHQNPNSQ